MCVFKKHLKTSWIASSLAEIVTDPFYILCPQKFGTSKLFGLNLNFEIHLGNIFDCFHLISTFGSNGWIVVFLCLVFCP